jgi:hypothetical protein
LIGWPHPSDRLSTTLTGFIEVPIKNLGTIIREGPYLSMRRVVLVFDKLAKTCLQSRQDEERTRIRVGKVEANYNFFDWMALNCTFPFIFIVF